MGLAGFGFARRFAAQPGGRLWAAYSLLTGLAVLIFLVAASVVLSGNGEFGGLFQCLAVERDGEVGAATGDAQALDILEPDEVA